MGPNVDYGPVSIILKKEILSHPQSELIINSSGTFISGTSFELRPWAGNLIFWRSILTCNRCQNWVSRLQCYLFYWDFWISYICSKNSQREKRNLGEFTSSLFRQKLDKRTCKVLWVSIHLFFQKKLKQIREVAGQARIACSGSPIFREKTKNHTNEGTIYESYKLDLKMLLFDEFRKQLPLNKIGNAEILDWYLNVDSHGRIEALLPSTVPIDQIDWILLPTHACTPEMTNILSKIRISSSTSLLDKTIVAKDEAAIKSIQVQFHWVSK